jgi:voltage-gated sodium channel
MMVHQEGLMVAGTDDQFVRGKGWQERRAALRAFFQSRFWERTIVVLIIINAIVLGLETSPSIVGQLGGALRLIDNIIIAIFTVEITLRLFAFGRSFWRDGWNVFDFFIVAIALMPSTGGFSVLRSLRIIRALRLISTVKSMRRVMTGMLRAIPSMGAVVALLALIFYVCAVMATKLFGDQHPELFGTLGHSFYSLFQVMTLEGWADKFVDPVLMTHPFAWIFFLIFILVTSFAVLNLFIGIIVDAMQSEQEEELDQDRVRSRANFDTIMAELHALRAEVGALRSERGQDAAAGNPQAQTEG